MMQYLIVKDNRVVNVIDWDGKTPWAPPEGCSVTPRTQDAWIGWQYAAGIWSEPVPEPAPAPAQE